MLTEINIHLPAKTSYQHGQKHSQGNDTLWPHPNTLVHKHTHISTKKRLWRERLSPSWSKGRGERVRGAVFVHKPSFEDGCYGDQPQICQFMKGRQSAAASQCTHTYIYTHTDTLTHLLHSQHLQTAQHCCTASEDTKLTNQHLFFITHLCVWANHSFFFTAALHHPPIKKHL